MVNDISQMRIKTRVNRVYDDLVITIPSVIVEMLKIREGAVLSIPYLLFDKVNDEQVIANNEQVIAIDEQVIANDEQVMVELCQPKEDSMSIEPTSEIFEVIEKHDTVFKTDKLINPDDTYNSADVCSTDFDKKDKLEDEQIESKEERIARQKERLIEINEKSQKDTSNYPPAWLDYYPDGVESRIFKRHDGENQILTQQQIVDILDNATPEMEYHFSKFVAWKGKKYGIKQVAEKVSNYENNPMVFENHLRKLGFRIGIEKREHIRSMMSLRNVINRNKLI
jgi:hypothetical protein